MNRTNPGANSAAESAGKVAGGKNPPAIVAPVAWQNFGEWALTGQHGMRPIYLSVMRGRLAVREPSTDRRIPLTPDHPVAVYLELCVNQHEELLAVIRGAHEFFSEGFALAAFNPNDPEESKISAGVKAELDKLAGVLKRNQTSPATRTP